MNIFSKNLLMASGEKKWVQPILTANGTIGGNSFAVYASGDTNAYRAFDSSASTYWSVFSVVPLIIYNPQALLISELTFYYTSKNYSLAGMGTSGYSVQGSNNNSTYSSISFSETPSSNNTISTLTLNHSIYYKYYKITLNADYAWGGNQQARLKNVVIKAIEE